NAGWLGFGYVEAGQPELALPFLEQAIPTRQVLIDRGRAHLAPHQEQLALEAWSPLFQKTQSAALDNQLAMPAFLLDVLRANLRVGLRERAIHTVQGLILARATDLMALADVLIEEIPDA